MSRNFWKSADVAPPLSDLRAVPRDIFGEGGDDAPKSNPASDRAIDSSIAIAERTDARNEAAVTRLMPYVEDNMRTQNAAAHKAFDQSEIDRADYNTLGRPAIERQAIGHGLTRYVDDQTASSLYDLYATRRGLVGGSGTTSAASVAGAAGTTGSASVAQGVNQATTASQAGAGGLIVVNGKTYSPSEIEAALIPPNARHSGGSFANVDPLLDRIAPDDIVAAAKSAGYTLGNNGVLSASGSPTTAQSVAGTTSDVRQSEGIPAQQQTASGSAGGDAQLAALLKSSGVGEFKTPQYAVSFTGADGATASRSPDQVLASLNGWRNKPQNAAVAHNLKAQLDAATAAGYKIKQNTDGSYAFDGDPKVQFAALTKTAKDAYDTRVGEIKKNAGITTLADNNKAIWQAENGLEKTAIDTESQRAADAAGTDVTRAVGLTNGMLERQARGMTGFDPNKFARVIASNGVNLGNTALMAGGINTARENARREVIGMSDAGTTNTINTTRGLPSQAINWSASGQNSGNSAVGNGMTAIAGNNAAVAPALQGWGQVGQLGMAKYNAETNAYNVAQQNSGGGIGGMLGMGKAGMDIAMGAKALGWIGSDRRLKENITLVGDGPHGVGLYEFNYIGDDKRMRGVMADEVESVRPDAVAYDDLGFASVNYGMLGLEMVEV